MKKKINIDQETIVFLYKKNKNYILPVLIIFVCIFLFFQVIIPQINNLFELQKQAKVEQVKLETLRKNLTSLTNLDPSVLESQYKIATAVFPVNKDFAGIIGAISVAAGKSGLLVGDYDFSVGDVSKPQTDVKKFPFLKISVNLSGDIKNASGFISELYKTAPLSEVVSLSSSTNSISLTINFYYKTIPPINFKEEIPLQALSVDSRKHLADIAKWSNLSFFDAFSSPPASSSGTANLIPF